MNDVLERPATRHLTAVAAGRNANDRRRSTRRKLVAAGAGNAGSPPIPTLTEGEAVDIQWSK